jgi:hypothetical protein
MKINTKFYKTFFKNINVLFFQISEFSVVIRFNKKNFNETEFQNYFDLSIADYEIKNFNKNVCELKIFL